MRPKKLPRRPTLTDQIRKPAYRTNVHTTIDAAKSRALLLPVKASPVLCGRGTPTLSDLLGELRIPLISFLRTLASNAPAASEATSLGPSILLNGPVRKCSHVWNTGCFPCVDPQRCWLQKALLGHAPYSSHCRG